MDIRDIQEEPKEVGGKYLEEIYELQKFLIDHYIGIEGLPQYPIDVNVKKNQTLLKDFTGRVTEELAEGYESHILVGQLTEANRFWIDENPDDPSEEYDMMLNHLQNLNEEQADALHFLIELLIYANIQPSDINTWINTLCKERKITHQESDGDIIKKAMDFGHLIVMSDYSPEVNRTVWLLAGINPNEIDEKMKYLPGGKYYSKALLEDSKKTLWDITQALNISRNCLKNKPWKQSGVMTDELLYQSKLVEAFIYTMAYFKVLRMSSWDVYYLYFKKNMINRFRIKSNY